MEPVRRSKRLFAKNSKNSGTDQPKEKEGQPKENEDKKNEREQPKESENQPKESVDEKPLTKSKENNSENPTVNPSQSSPTSVAEKIDLVTHTKETNSQTLIIVAILILMISAIFGVLYWNSAPVFDHTVLKFPLSTEHMKTLRNNLKNISTEQPDATELILNSLQGHYGLNPAVIHLVTGLKEAGAAEKKLEKRLLIK